MVPDCEIYLHFTSWTSLILAVRNQYFSLNIKWIIFRITKLLSNFVFLISRNLKLLFFSIYRVSGLSWKYISYNTHKKSRGDWTWNFFSRVVGFHFLVVRVYIFPFYPIREFLTNSGGGKVLIMLIYADCKELIYSQNMSIRWDETFKPLDL